jgi:hypothetical protein
LTTGKINPNDVAVGAAYGALPVLGIASAKNEGEAGFQTMLYFVMPSLLKGVARAAAPLLEAAAPYATPAAAVAAPLGVMWGTKVLMGGQTLLGLHGGWGSLVKYPGGYGSPALPGDD